MNQLTGALKIILPVVLTLGVGIVCRKTGVLQKKGVDALKALAVSICLPAVLIRAFYQAEYTMRIVIIAAAMFLVCCLALALGFGVKKALRGTRLTPFLMTGFEAGMLGYALYALLFPSLTPFATVDLGQVLFVFTVYFTLLKRNEGGTLASSLKSMAASPVIISIALGVALGATGLGQRIGESAVGPVVQSVLDFVAAPTSFIILLVVGYELEIKKGNLLRALAAAGIRLIVMAALCALTLLAVGSLTPVDKPLAWAFILMFLLPPPFVLPVFVKSEDENAFISATLSLSTLVSLAGFAVILMLAV
jgi:hypothetical protein